MRRTSYAIVELSGNAVFPFLVYEETYTCLSIVGLRVVQQVATLESARVVKLSSFLRTSPSPITSHFMLFSFSSSSSSCTCSSFSNVITFYVAIFSRSPCVVVPLDPEILSTPCM